MLNPVALEPLEEAFEQVARRHGVQPDQEWVDFAALLAARYIPPPTGRHSVVADQEITSRLLHHLAQCNHRDTACHLAGTTPVTLNACLKRGEAGEEPFNAFLWAVKRAESAAEDSARADVLAAGKDPRFWTAPMTWLERKWPGKYAKPMRDEDGTPKVVVNLGIISDRDVQFQVGLSPAPFASHALPQGAVTD